MPNTQPPTCKTYFMDLPLARLHIMEAGTGAPLIIVPATISELEDWQHLTQFMAQWFRVYFFELPGHGQSEPFKEKFSSHQVAELVGQLADALGHERFNLMAFSFGGILAMRTFKLLGPRIDRLVLIAPCLDHRALTFSSLHLNFLFKFNKLLSYPKIQARFVNLIHNDRTIAMMVKTLQKFGKLEETIPLKKKLQTKSRVVILLTDGVNNSGSIAPETAGEIAKTFGVRVYSVGVGTNGFAPTPMKTPFGVQYQNVPVQINEDMLRKVSKETDGIYYRATNNKKLRDIYAQIDKLEKTKVEVTEFRR